MRDTHHSWPEAIALGIRTPSLLTHGRQLLAGDKCLHSPARAPYSFLMCIQCFDNAPLVVVRRGVRRLEALLQYSG
jgi:hypothetical protein